MKKIKKIYESPIIELLDIKCGSILTGSPSGNIGIDKNGPGSDEQLSAERRGNWGNIWSTK